MSSKCTFPSNTPRVRVLTAASSAGPRLPGAPEYQPQRCYSAAHRRLDVPSALERYSVKVPSRFSARRFGISEDGLAVKAFSQQVSRHSQKNLSESKPQIVPPATENGAG